MYETFAHTADLGLRVRAATVNELFADAACGLTSMLVANLDAVRPVEEVHIELAGEALDYLLFDWLTELLYRFEAEHWLFGQFDVAVSDEGALSANCRGERMDVTRHQMDHEVKAITYHGLRVERTADGWFAELIVDI
jgi:SHS2 domain-containing protein